MQALLLFTILAAALPTALALAHALERPGKMRLDEQTYRAVQGIYYPGFTIGGFAEPVAVIAAAALTLLTPPDTPRFFLFLAAAIGMAGFHAVYWLVVHPVNRQWAKGQELDAAGKLFFQSGAAARGEAPDWTRLRDRWERGHTARAALGVISLLALLIAAIFDM
jgi:hypothetical protein